MGEMVNNDKGVCLTVLAVQAVVKLQSAIFVKDKVDVETLPMTDVYPVAATPLKPSFSC